jgi:hypothetical protein
MKILFKKNPCNDSSPRSIGSARDAGFLCMDCVKRYFLLNILS